MTMNYEVLKAAIDAGRVSHSRAGTGLYRGAALVYERRADSPTGVVLLGVVDDGTPAADLLRGMLSPLSPTEAR